MHRLRCLISAAGHQLQHQAIAIAASRRLHRRHAHLFARDADVAGGTAACWGGSAPAALATREQPPSRAHKHEPEHACHRQRVSVSAAASVPCWHRAQCSRGRLATARSTLMGRRTVVIAVPQRRWLSDTKPPRSHTPTPGSDGCDATGDQQRGENLPAREGSGDRARGVVGDPARESKGDVDGQGCAEGGEPQRDSEEVEAHIHQLLADVIAPNVQLDGGEVYFESYDHATGVGVRVHSCLRSLRHRASPCVACGVAVNCVLCVLVYFFFCVRACVRACWMS